MASEIRVDKINSLSGVGTVTLSPTGVDIAGITTAATLRATTGIATDFTADKITLPDSSAGSINVGLGSDLTIYHDGSNSFIKNSTGNLRIQDANGNIQIQAKAGEESIIAKTDGAVELYYDNSKKLETTSGGVSITGNCNVDGNITLSDSEEIQIGNSTDFRIYHDGNNTFLRDVGAGSLSISGSQVSFDSSNLAEYMVRAIENGAVELYHDGTKMIETISTGTNIPDGKFAKFGNSNDMSMGHNTYNYITYVGADLLVTGDATYQIKLMPKSDEAAIVCKPNAEVELYHDGTLQCETAADGLAFPSGKGINFNLTADASGTGVTAGSETLDDYEEGTWTPVIKNTGQTPNWTSINGRYTRIGEQVTCWFNVDGGSTPRSGGAGTSLIMTGMPFTISMFGNPIQGIIGANDEASNGLYSTTGLILNIFGQGGSQVRFGCGGQPINKSISYAAGCFTYTAA